MFIDFFFAMRRGGLKVSLGEWMTLMESLQLDHPDNSLVGFYHICRAICIKSEGLYDRYDQVFQAHFNARAPSETERHELRDWLDQAAETHAKEFKRYRDWDLEKMREELEKRLEDQKKRHDGGNHWVGTGGTSPFGNSGYHDGGIRIGGGGRHGSAAQIVGERKFRNLRSDRVMDTRSIALALKKLRHLGRQGQKSELDIDDTITNTARQGGDIDICLKAPRRNRKKLLLLMDVGGSMTPHTQLCEKLFSAANSAKHFKEMRSYYFHNCPYDFLFSDIYHGKRLNTAQLLKELDATWNLIMVGDAAMNPYELIAEGGAIDYYYHNSTPGIEWLRRIHRNFPRAVWLNPEPPEYWNIPSTRLVKNVFTNMFPLTLKGLSAAIEKLNRCEGA